MGAQPQEQATQGEQIPTIIAKIAQLKERMHELIAANQRLHAVTGTQAAEIRDLKQRIHKLETKQQLARDKLKELVSQLPDK